MSQQAGSWLWSKNLVALSLFPLSILFCAITRIRSYLYKTGVYKSSKPNCGVIVVGNITVGGNGKTPVVIYLVNKLQKLNLKVGVVTRGYKSQAESTITLLNSGEQNDLVGDESNMLSEICQCPIAVGIDRPEAAQKLYERFKLDIIISDDGLQHYALDRDIEIVIKRDRAMGNGWCLPAGPLREAKSRLATVDVLIDRNSDDVIESVSEAWSLNDSSETKALSEFGETVHAIAGIGFPDSFFEHLRANGLDIIEHHFSDHYDYSKLDVSFNDELPILMTHKDAVKLKRFELNNAWVVPLELIISPKIDAQINQLIKHITNREK